MIVMEFGLRTIFLEFWSWLPRTRFGKRVGRHLEQSFQQVVHDILNPLRV